MLEEMRKLIEEFVTQILNVLNESYEAYYEEAPITAKFPYLVVPTLNLTPLDAGYTCIFDVEIYNNELSKISTEDIMDYLIQTFKDYCFCNDKIGFHTGFENGNIVKIQEQDLIERRVSFCARLFKKGD